MFLKEAIRLGVDGYLLKPIDPDELLSNLRNLVSVIEEELLKSSRIYQGMELLRTNTLNRLITNEIGRNELEEKAELLELTLDAAWYLCVVCVPAGENGDADECADPSMTLALQEDYRKQTDANGCAFLDPKNRLVLLVFGRDEADVLANSRATLELITNQARERWGKPLRYTTGLAVSSREEVYRSYTDALEKLIPQNALPEEEPLEGRWRNAVDRTIDYIGAHYHGFYQM